jgi:hypothetical protein
MVKRLERLKNTVNTYIYMADYDQIDLRPTSQNGSWS